MWLAIFHKVFKSAYKELTLSQTCIKTSSLLRILKLIINYFMNYLVDVQKCPEIVQEFKFMKNDDVLINMDHVCMQILSLLKIAK